MSDLWLIPLGVGGLGAAVLLACLRKLDATVSELQRAMRPLRVRSRHVQQR